MKTSIIQIGKLVLTTSLLITAVACSNQGDQAVRGFILPKGDAEIGKATFVAIGCPKCHTVAGANIEQPPGEQFHIELGGQETRVKHYGDLLTSVVNPDHKVAKAFQVSTEAGKSDSSPMPKFTSRMTVDQLVDIVEFLHTSYTSTQPDYLGPYYYYGP